MRGDLTGRPSTFVGSLQNHKGRIMPRRLKKNLNHGESIL